MDSYHFLEGGSQKICHNILIQWLKSSSFFQPNPLQINYVNLSTLKKSSLSLSKMHQSKHLNVKEEVRGNIYSPLSV